MRLAETTTAHADEDSVGSLYFDLLDAWNRRSAEDYANLFEEQGSVVGFDGSQMVGREEIATELGRIFRDHDTAAYVGKVKSVRPLAPGVTLLRAISGMVPPGQTELNPTVNTVQTLFAIKQGDTWRVTSYQNTPAALHGRPDLVAEFTEELKQVLNDPAR